MDPDRLRRIPGEFDVIACDLPSFTGDWAWMEHGDPLSERTARLREKYRLDEVIAGCPSEWEQLLALKRWVRSRWNHGWSRGSEALQDALDILRAADLGAQLNCGFYARAFIECARALGLVARIVSLGVRDCGMPRGYNYGNVGHVANEAWSDEHRKWALLDCDLNLHYARGGLPLSALEVHGAWLSGEAEAVEVVQDQPEFVVPSGRCLDALRETEGYESFDEERVRRMCERFGRHQAMDYYARLQIGNRTWLDRRCLPTFVSHFGPGATGMLTSNPDDLYPTVNLVRLSARADWSDGPRLSIALEHCVPWFHHYEARIDGGAWQEQPQAFDWRMREGRNVLEVRGVNVCGRPGAVSRLEVAHASPQWVPGGAR